MVEDSGPSYRQSEVAFVAVVVVAAASPEDDGVVFAARASIGGLLMVGDKDAEVAAVVVEYVGVDAAVVYVVCE